MNCQKFTDQLDALPADDMMAAASNVADALAPRKDDPARWDMTQHTETLCLLSLALGSRGSTQCHVNWCSVARARAIWCRQSECAEIAY